MTEIKELSHELIERLPPVDAPNKVGSRGLKSQSAINHQVLDALNNVITGLTNDGLLDFGQTDARHPRDLTTEQAEIVLRELQTRLKISDLNPHKKQGNHLRRLGFTDELVKDVLLKMKQG